MAWNLITSVSAASSDGVTVTSPAFDSTGADLILAWFSTVSNGTASPTDSKGNTLTPLIEENVAGGERGILYYIKNPGSVGPGHTISIAESISAVCVQVWSGSNLTAPFDKESGANVFGTTLATGSVTPAQDGSLIVTGIASNVAEASPYSIDSGFTKTGDLARTANNIGAALAYLVQGTAAAVNPTWTATSATHQATRIAVFKPSGGVAFVDRATPNILRALLGT